MQIEYFFKDEPELWTNEVEAVAREAFDEIDLAVRHGGKSGLITGTVSASLSICACERASVRTGSVGGCMGARARALRAYARAEEQRT